MEHEYSILYEPVNALLKSIGLYLPDHVLMALLVTVISLIIFPMLARNVSREDPGFFQQAMELLISGLKGLLDDIVGHGAANRFLPIIAGFTVFIFLSNIFGIFFFLQPPTGNPNTTFALALMAFLYLPRGIPATRCCTGRRGSVWGGTEPEQTKGNHQRMV